MTSTKTASVDADCLECGAALGVGQPHALGCRYAGLISIGVEYVRP